MVTAGATSDAPRLVRGLRWIDLGRSTRAAWGRCQGSAATPYETVVSADRPTVSSCSCPSRQRPCKHARGLAELAGDGQIALIEEPAWVAQLVSRRPFAGHRRGGSRPATDGGGVVDPEAAARRAEARRAKVTAGLAELRLWLGDQVRTGLAGLPRAGYGHFDAIAARMVDAQAPGVAGTLRSLPADLVSADWPSRALHSLGGLQLLAEAHARLDELPDDLAATVRSRVGYAGEQGPGPRPSAGPGPLVGDRRRRHRRVPADQPAGLAAGPRHRPVGDVADVRAAGRDLDTSVQPGRVYDCEARFYPGSGQFRVLLEPPLPDPDLPAEDAVAADAVTSTRGWGGDDLGVAPTLSSRRCSPRTRGPAGCRW